MVKIRGIIVDQRGLPFGYPVAPNRIIANCLLAGKKKHREQRKVRLKRDKRENLWKIARETERERERERESEKEIEGENDRERERESRGETEREREEEEKREIEKQRKIEKVRRINRITWKILAFRRNNLSSNTLLFTNVLVTSSTYVLLYCPEYILLYCLPFHDLPSSSPDGLYIFLGSSPVYRDSRVSDLRTAFNNPSGPGGTARKRALMAAGAQGNNSNRDRGDNTQTTSSSRGMYCVLTNFSIL